MSPDRDLLCRFLLGQGTTDEVAGVERWLVEEPGAVERLQTLIATEDTLVSVLHGNRPAGEDSPSVAALIARVAALRDRRDPPQDVTEQVSVAPGGERSCPTTEVGPQFLGQFRIDRLIGEGGMGNVYEAHDQRLSRRVALKVIKPVIAADPKAKARFLREARAAAAVEHDHIVPILQVGEEGGCLYLAMPFLKGEALDVRLKRDERLPVADVLKIGRETALGLAAAHAQGLVHRDIKPANLWLEARPEGYRVKILDFGLAQTSGEGGEQLTQSGAILGTPAYMAPEQARGVKADARCDLYSLGAVLYRLTTGRLPFQGDSTMALLMALAMETPAPVRSLNPEVPERLARLVERLLSKDPEQRPATALVVERELQAIEREGDRTEVIRPEPTPEPARRQPSRGSLVAIAAVLLVLLAGAAFAVYKFVLETPQGKFVVEISDPEIETRFKNGELFIYGADGKQRYALKPSPPNKDLPVGVYRVEVAGADGLKLISDEFTITKGNETIVRVRMEKPDAVVKVPPPAVKPDAEKPFVVVRGDGKREALKTFPAALEVVGPDVIEIHANGPLAIGPVTRAKGESLRLVAGAGYRPMLVPAASVWENYPEHAGRWFKVVDGAVELDGLDIDGRGPKPLYLLSGGGRWEIRRSRLVNLEVVAEYRSGAGVTINDSLIVAIDVCQLANPDTELRLGNNLIRSACVVTMNSTGKKIHLDRNTLVMIGGKAFAIFGEKSQGGTITAVGNVINLSGCAYGLPLPPEKLALVSWTGRDNLYVRANAYVKKPDGKEEWDVDLRHWNSLLKVQEVGSRNLPFQSSTFAAVHRWDDPWVGDVAVARAGWRTDVEASRRQYAIPDLGPDLERIGPGRPYWDTFPKDRASKQEPLDGGPIVALANGKELAGFATLQAAFEKAPAADTFEIRTDRLVEDGVLPAGRGRVTIRGGYGYSPQVKSLTVEKGCQLTAEGFTLEKDATLLVREEGWIARLAHLSCNVVNGPCSPDIKAPTEATACLVRLMDFTAGHVTVKDSVLERLWAIGPQKKRSLIVDRCLFAHRTADGWMGTPFSTEFGADNQWSVRRTLVDCRAHMLQHIDPKMWSGERNVYRFEFGLVAGVDIPDLDSFRKWTGSPETGCVMSRCSDFDPTLWALRDEVRKDLGGKEYGADVSRILAPRDRKPGN